MRELDYTPRDNCKRTVKLHFLENTILCEMTFYSLLFSLQDSSAGRDVLLLFCVHFHSTGRAN